MNFETTEFDISDEASVLGLTAACFAMRDVHNRDFDPDFERLRDTCIKKVVAGLKPDALKSDPILAGFRRLHLAVGSSNRRNIASSENLLSQLQRNGSLPHVNLLVDIYNLVSVQTRLSLGSHDIARISGNVHLRLTDGTEQFRPMGKPGPISVRSGEYAYVDDSNSVLCRLEVRQGETTKVTLDTTDCLCIVQGNGATSAEYIKAATERLIVLIREFCGGRENLLYVPW